MKAENKCPCGVDLYKDVQLCPKCVDKAQLELYEYQCAREESEDSDREI